MRTEDNSRAEFLAVTVDVEVKETYVTYSRDAVAFTTDVWDEGRVSADRDSAGNIVGIEIVGFGAIPLRQAELFAEQLCLQFPSNPPY